MRTDGRARPEASERGKGRGGEAKGGGQWGKVKKYGMGSGEEQSKGIMEKKGTLCSSLSLST